MAWTKKPIDSKNPIIINDILNGKRIAIGGSSSAATGRTPNEKNYWQFIQDRTGILINDVAASGSTLTSIIDDYMNDSGSNLLKQISWMPVSSKIDAVVLQVASNDDNNKRPLGTFESTTPTEVYGALHIMCKNLYTKYPTLPIGVLTSQYTMPLTALDSPYQNAVKEVCGYYGIPVCDLRKEGGTPYTFPTWQNTYAPDGSHLSVAGDLKMSYRVESFVRSLFGH